MGWRDGDFFEIFYSFRGVIIKFLGLVGQCGLHSKSSTNHLRPNINALSINIVDF